MTAFFVATVTVKDPAKFREYGQGAMATFAPHGGEVVLRGKADGALVGAVSHHAIAIVKFPDRAALDAWFNSAEYQALVPLRDQACDMTIVAYAVPA